jgi:hypothetical protein
MPTMRGDGESCRKDLPLLSLRVSGMIFEPQLPQCRAAPGCGEGREVSKEI